MSKFKRTDTNHSEITRGLRSIGIVAFDTSQLGKGFGDIVVGDGGHNFIFEIKTTREGRLTEDEQEFWDMWPGQIAKVWSVGSVLAYLIQYYDKVDDGANLGRVKSLYWKWKERQK